MASAKKTAKKSGRTSNQTAAAKPARKAPAWKSPLATVERRLEKDAHESSHPTSRTAYGHLVSDPLTPLAGLPLEALRLFRLQPGAPLAPLSTLSKLETLWFEDLHLPAPDALEAALTVPSLRTLFLQPTHTRKDQVLPDELIERLVRALPALEHLLIRDVTLSDRALSTLFSTRRLVDVQLSGIRGLEHPVIEDQPALRGLHFYAWAPSLRISRLPALEQFILGGSFETATLEGLPRVTELGLIAIEKHAVLRDVGFQAIPETGCWESVEVSGAPGLSRIELSNAADSLPKAQLEGLRAALPTCELRLKR